jgi:hypothetical protein
MEKVKGRRKGTKGKGKEKGQGRKKGKRERHGEGEGKEEGNKGERQGEGEGKEEGNKGERQGEGEGKEEGNKGERQGEGEGKGKEKGEEKKGREGKGRLPPPNEIPGSATARRSLRRQTCCYSLRSLFSQFAVQCKMFMLCRRCKLSVREIAFQGSVDWKPIDRSISC